MARRRHRRAVRLRDHRGVSRAGSGNRGGAAGGDLGRTGDLGGEAVEELVGHLLAGRVDEAGAELGHLAPDLRLHGVAEQRVGPVIGEVDRGAALGEAGAALALTLDAVAVRLVEVEQMHLAAELRGHRADAHGGGGGVVVRAGALQRLAAGNAGAQHLRIVQRVPNLLPRRRDAPLACHVHPWWPPLNSVSPRDARGRGRAAQHGQSPWHGGAEVIKQEAAPGCAWPLETAHDLPRCH